MSLSFVKKRETYPQKRTMNLYYKQDRTTRPATVALYVMFLVAVLLALSKVLVYDLWAEVESARKALAAVDAQLDEVNASLVDYNEVETEYFRFSATPQEEATTDRMEVLNLIDSAVGTRAKVSSISINGSAVTMEFFGVTLAQTAEIVSALEASPLVESTRVSTAATTGGDIVRTSIYMELHSAGEGSSGAE